MLNQKNIPILYFTDLLCVWAYISQIRIDTIKQKFGSDITVHQHFVSVFGAVESKMEQNWGNKGGVSAYSDFVSEIARKFEHIEIHPDVWKKNTPTSSTGCHLLLKAIQILESRDELQDFNPGNYNGIGAFNATAWEMRKAFFRDLEDISNYQVQKRIIEKLGLPKDKIQTVIENGEAFAELENDTQLKEKYGVSGSPSLVLNEGRQIIYGNVGYSVIEANIQELLSQPENRASWC
ncbi:MAG: DsbA family protein [Gammaproteobacteria bacterium]|nr:DsbA family protein [Gammaproteobacteria bacterium]